VKTQDVKMMDRILDIEMQYIVMEQVLYVFFETKCI